jgi:hypothetical protein
MGKRRRGRGGKIKIGSSSRGRKSALVEEMDKDAFGW